MLYFLYFEKLCKNQTLFFGTPLEISRHLIMYVKLQGIVNVNINKLLKTVHSITQIMLTLFGRKAGQRERENHRYS